MNSSSEKPASAPAAGFVAPEQKKKSKTGLFILLGAALGLGVGLVLAVCLVVLGWRLFGAAKEMLPGDNGQFEKHLKTQVQSESEGSLSLVEVRKTNGTRGSLLGVPQYEMELAGTMKIEKEGVWRVPANKQRFRVESRFGGTEESLSKAGTTWNFHGTMSFYQTEKGWLVQGYEFYRD